MIFILRADVFFKKRETSYANTGFNLYIRPQCSRPRTICEAKQ